MKKILPWAILILILFAVARNPAGSANFTHRILADLGKLADGLGRFIANLAGGR